MEPGNESSDAWKTSRLLLRRPTFADIGEVLRLHRDPRAIEHNPGDALEEESAAQQLVQRWVQHWDDHGIGYWMLSWQEDAAVLGVCGVKVMAMDGCQVLNLLYRLHPAAWGQGVATEAATAVVARALRHHLDLPIVARVRPANHASARVALAAGLLRAEHLDTWGEDGPEHLFVSRASIDRTARPAAPLNDPLPGSSANPLRDDPAVILGSCRAGIRSCAGTSNMSMPVTGGRGMSSALSWRTACS